MYYLEARPALTDARL